MRLLAPLLMAACVGFAATAQGAPITTEAKLVAALTALPAADRATASGRGAALLRENFGSGDNSCSAPGNPALSFDQLCQWTAPAPARMTRRNGRTCSSAYPAAASSALPCRT